MSPLRTPETTSLSGPHRHSTPSRPPPSAPWALPRPSVPLVEPVPLVGNKGKDTGPQPPVPRPVRGPRGQDSRRETWKQGGGAGPKRRSGLRERRQCCGEGPGGHGEGEGRTGSPRGHGGHGQGAGGRGERARGHGERRRRGERPEWEDGQRAGRRGERPRRQHGQGVGRRGKGPRGVDGPGRRGRWRRRGRPALLRPARADAVRRVGGALPAEGPGGVDETRPPPAPDAPAEGRDRRPASPVRGVRGPDAVARDAGTVRGVGRRAEAPVGRREALRRQPPPAHPTRVVGRVGPPPVVGDAEEDAPEGVGAQRAAVADAGAARARQDRQVVALTPRAQGGWGLARNSNSGVAEWEATPGTGKAHSRVFDKWEEPGARCQIQESGGKGHQKTVVFNPGRGNSKASKGTYSYT